MNVQTTEVAVTQVKFTPLFEKNSLTRADAGHKLIRSRAEPSRAEPSRAEPSRAEPSRAEPSRAEPSRAEPSRAEPSRAEPSRTPSSCPPGRVVLRLSGYRSGRPPSSLPCAPFRAQSDPLLTDPGGSAPPSRRRKPTSVDRQRGRAGRFLSACIRRAAAILLLGCAATLGADDAWAATLVSNLDQSSGSGETLDTDEYALAFSTGSHAAGYTLSGIKLKFVTSMMVLRTPGVTDTVTVTVTDGLASTATTVATLTSPGTWTETSTFTVSTLSGLAGYGPRGARLVRGSSGTQTPGRHLKG